jgi:valine--pyruvate aminotransferase
MSGLRSIMADVAVTQSAGNGERWLNLGVGNPAPIAEVAAMWRDLAEQTLRSDFVAESSRYGPSRGNARLVDVIVDYFAKTYGWKLTPDNVVVGPGSQMLCFIAAALFTGPGEDGMRRLVLPCVPDYAGYLGMSLDSGGAEGIAPRVRPIGGHHFRYLLDHDALRDSSDVGLLMVSSPSNPTGRSLDEDDMGSLVAVAEANDAVLVVDNAYGQPFPRVARTAAPPLWHPNVINCFSVSKAGLPGERLGFAVGAPEQISAMVSFIANSTLHAPHFPQLMLARALESGRLDELAGTVVEPYYAARRRTAEELLHEYLPDDLNWRLHTGEGGMFCWLWIDEPWFDDAELYARLKDRRVVVVPGRHFFPGPDGAGRHATRCVRLSITSGEATVREGIRVVADALVSLAGRPDSARRQHSQRKEKLCPPL